MGLDQDISLQLWGDIIGLIDVAPSRYRIIYTRRYPSPLFVCDLITGSTFSLFESRHRHAHSASARFSPDGEWILVIFSYGEEVCHIYLVLVAERLHSGLGEDIESGDMFQPQRDLSFFSPRRFFRLCFLILGRPLRGVSQNRPTHEPAVLQPREQNQVVAEDRAAHAGGVILKSLEKAPAELKSPF